MKTSYYDSAAYHIYCYFGDTYDVFVDETLLPQTLTELLHRDLKRCGYERVIFFDYNRGAYFLDLESKEMMQGKKASPVTPVIRSAFKGKLLGGSTGVTQPRAAQELSFTLDPAEMIRYAGEFLSDGSVKTAVIFPDGLNMLENMQTGTDSGAMLNNLFHQISNIHDPTNRNLMILLFNRRESAVADFFHGQKWDYVWKSIREHSVFHRIPPVSPDEIRLAIHSLRLTGINGRMLQVNCAELTDICQMIAGKIRRNISTEQQGLQHTGTRELNARQLKHLLTHLMDHFIIPGTELDLQTCREMCAQKEQAPALERLDAMIGMQELKDTLRAYIQKHTGGMKQEVNIPLRLEPPVAVTKKHAPNLHFVLTGNKGTGKTTAAKLIGEVLAEYGLLPSGHLVETRPSKLIGEYVGHSEANMRDALERAKGGVLFIDEAYGFDSGIKGAGSYHEGMVNELVGHMTLDLEACSVILAGYPDEMEQMFQNVNPGLRERFQNHIHIADYTPGELAQIFHLKAARQGRAISEELDAALVPFLDNWYSDNQDDWANGRNIENLLNDMMLKPGDTLTPDMIKPELAKYLTDEVQKSVREQLDAMIGLETVKEKITAFEIKLLYGRSKARNYHFVFSGNPGTGKTSVARLFGQLLKGAGILKSGTVNEVKAEHLLKSPDALDREILRSRNRVLFIDEAYQLLGTPLIDQLVEKTNPDAVDFPFCAICAGYDADMDRFMNANIGMDRRFDVIHFDNYCPEQLLEITAHVLRTDYSRFTVTEGFLRDTLAHFRAHREVIAAKFNAGYVSRYLEEAELLLYRKFYTHYGKTKPPAEAYILDETVVPDHFCGHIH